jgi:hypothetical protein
MDVGILEDELAATLHLTKAEVRNLAMPGATPWDIQYLVDRLDPPHATGPRIAIVQIDRAWFNPKEVPISNYARFKLLQLPEKRAQFDAWERLRASFVAIFPERREAREWLVQVRYGWLARIAPRLVPVPERTPVLWSISHEAQQIAQAALDRKARKALTGDEFAEHSVDALRLFVDELRRRSYRVVLMITPLRREVLESIENTPASAAQERRIRQVLFDPSISEYTLMEVRDAKALGTDDDLIFLDYGHLNRTGAELLTRKLAEVIIQLKLLDPRQEAPTTEMDSQQRSTASSHRG